jgi:hypothetical protein
VTRKSEELNFLNNNSTRSRQEGLLEIRNFLFVPHKAAPEEVGSKTPIAQREQPPNHEMPIKGKFLFRQQKSDTKQGSNGKQRMVNLMTNEL